MLAAFGEMTERSCARINAIPTWDLKTVESRNRTYTVGLTTLSEQPFCRLSCFEVEGRPRSARQLMVIPPMSGHYPTLIRPMIASLLPDCDVVVTEWKNARDVPVGQGKFDIEDYTNYLVEFIRLLGSHIHVIAVCQPAPLALAATAELARIRPDAQPRSLVLMGGPVVPEAAPTEITAFGHRVTRGQLEHFLIQRVAAGNPGAGRMVFPGSLQLASFMAMNADLHRSSYARQLGRIVKGTASNDDRHNTFYDEYLAVMDLPAEFYISTVNRIFKNGEIANNRFRLGDRQVDLELISRTAVMSIEGGRDDIAAPGQTSAALPMLKGIPESMKAAHVEPDVGHYGIFSGRGWRNSIRPKILEFIDAHAPKEAEAAAANGSVG